MNRFRERQSGSVLLYSLLVISLITAIAIIISVIIVNEIKLTSAATNGIQAYYAAESGIEKGLFAVKTIKNDPTQTLGNAVAAIQGFNDNNNGNNFENNASYNNDETVSRVSTFVNMFVKEDDYVQIDYYDVDNTLESSGVVGITVSNSGDNPATWAEVTWTAWDVDGNLGTSTEAKKLIGPSDLASADGWPINNLDVFDMVPMGYRVRVKAIKIISSQTESADLSSLTVIPYDGTPPPLGTGTEVTDLSSQLLIKSIGERSNFKQSLTATVPWNLPLFGLYDYVLYSEGDILKDIILSSPTYSSGVIQIEADNETTGTCSDCAQSAGTCVDRGWLAEGCSGSNITCEISAGSNTSWCSLPPAGTEFFTLPIPESIPAGEEYYLSLRYRPQQNSVGTLEMLIDDPQEGELGLTFDYSAGINVEEWDTCTLDETFALSSELDRNITYVNKDVESFIDLDWYQVSTYKIFPDCE